MIDPPLAHGLSLARGVALDDHLDGERRALADADARRLFDRWRMAHSAALTLERIDLIEVFEVELLAQCFLPAARLLHGLPAALQAAGAGSIRVRGLMPEPAALVAEIAAGAGAGVDWCDEAPAAREPIPRAALPPLAGLVGRIGAPARARGDLLCIPHTNIVSLVTELVRTPDAPRPVASRLLLSGLGTRGALAVAARGGWLGAPGRQAREASRVALANLLRGVDPGRWGGLAGGAGVGETALGLAVERYALSVLGRLGADTLAIVRHARRAISGGRIRGALIPFDGPDQVRMLLTVLREHDVPALLVQHGFNSRLGVPDMQLADRLAIWSEPDRTIDPGRDPATVTVTGNPGAEPLARRPLPPRRAALGRSIVIVDYASRLSARIDVRVSAIHVATALAGLAQARPGTGVIVRPHPSDQDPTSYQVLAARYPGLRMEIDSKEPIETLLSTVDLCVSAVSTVALEACALGIPTVLLDVTGIARPWPFDGSAFPVAGSGAELAATIATLLGDDAVIGREAACEALGVRADASARVLDLVADLVRR